MANIDQSTYNLIEKYLAGKLNSDEQYDFEIKMSLDKELEQEVKFQRILNESIRFGRRNQLKNFITENATTKLTGNVWGTTWTKISAVVIILATITFIISRAISPPHSADPPSYVAPYPYTDDMYTDVQNDTTATDTLLEQTESDTITEPEERVVPPRPIPRPEPMEQHSVSNLETDTSTGKPVLVPVEKPAHSLDSIRRDRMEKDTMVTVGRANGNPVKIEFWSSPVNYRGYKYYNNILTLYGISPQAVTLSQQRGNLILTLNGESYIITEQRNFSALQPVTRRRGR